jgi:hypothetical protein
MRARLLSFAALLLWVGCPLPSPNSGSNACPSTDDAGAYAGALYNLSDAGDLTLNFDAGNGGVDLGPSHLADGGLAHIYEWRCLTTFDCQTARDASLTFTSPNGVSQWSVVSLDFGNGQDCLTQAPPMDAGGSQTNCCIHCGANSQACGNYCIGMYDQCSAPAGCACP